MENNTNTTVNFEELRKHQTRPCDKDTIDQQRKALEELAVELVPDQKHNYHTTVKFNGQRIMELWHKQIACRITMNKNSLEKYSASLGMDLDSRVAMYREAKGSEIYHERLGEFALTFEEVVAAVKAIVEVAATMKDEKKPEAKDAPVEEKKPEEKKKPARKRKTKKEKESIALSDEMLENAIENPAA